MSDPLKTAILTRDLDDLVAELLFEKVPHVFDSDAPLYRKWRHSVASWLQVDPSELTIVGSAAVGISLNPNKDYPAFSERSDIDVAVVSDYHFSEAWHFLRSVDLALVRASQKQKTAITLHQRNYIYWGCVASDYLLPLLPFKIPWMAARTKAATLDPTRDRDINFRIYKDFRALRRYHRRGLDKLRAALLERK